MTRQRGFTLIEVIAAFALMALALTLCLSVASRAYRQVAWSDANARAVLWAQSLADEALAQPLAIGVQEGETPDHVFRWRREVAAWVDPSGAVIAHGESTGLLEISMQVSWLDGEATRSFSTRTLRLPSPKLVTGATP
ncbi:prepilin-type N-terminal cleavage/methylation domain-containing protein [Solilutibacter silvestris]|uniref:Prepilin-type N-terminal cleavage/methylation domain-containing protein n=1 Tax=Solilutibacter silvestris TaxID=1645665 RepID=A0A2K1Q468_9GAMM|nr:prepilin-type N-terminal cleavage/methylation domain-containing protein [Lysobacter silvestris]PNS09838.1 prepilin-type N-terminal cleavage/methylation domain-containing protein [Lysobacter silvestris]